MAKMPSDIEVRVIREPQPSRLCMVRQLVTDPWEWVWFHMWIYTSDGVYALVEQKDGACYLANCIRFPNTPALPKHAPPDVKPNAESTVPSDGFLGHVLIKLDRLKSAMGKNIGLDPEPDKLIAEIELMIAEYAPPEVE